LFSIGLSLILKSFKFFETMAKSEDLLLIIKEIKSKCPKCGTEFDSFPKYCYKCNTELTEKVEG
jgi:uncharacterized OB-fold protein